MHDKIGELKQGYTSLTNQVDQHPDMLQEIGIYRMFENETVVLFDEKQESAILLLEGKATIEWNDNLVEVVRKSVFDENPWCLHVPKGIRVAVVALEGTEVLVQKTDNNHVFEVKLYTPEECTSVFAGEGVWNGTAERVIRTIFDYSNAPYSNLVIGEVISYPGKWSSYPPHHHTQPEVYYYRFDKPQGFGCAMVGDEAYRLEHNSVVTIPGDLDHPQATAPGYAMYFCWMIRHLENNPWNDRVIEKEHEWLLDPEAKIWPIK